jgi:nicotinate-nucleotide adenylyltransferase
VALVAAAFARLHLSEVWVIPAGVPVHRQLSGQAGPSLRLAWMRRLFADEPRVTVIDWEVRQPGPVSSLQTLQWLRASHPEVLPLWLMGADAFAGLSTWKGYPEHRHYCNVAVFARAGEPMPGAQGWRECEAEAMAGLQAPGHVARVDAELPDVSATGLRQALASGRVPAGWLPAPIAADVVATYGNDGDEEQA